MSPPRTRKTSLARHLDRRNAPPPAPGMTPAPAETPAPPPGTAAASTIKIVRRSKMDAFAHLIGVKPDREVAELAGVTPENVRAWRKRRGIVARWRKDGAPAPRGPRASGSGPAAVPVREPPAPPPEVTAVQLVTGTRGFLVSADDDEEFVVVAPDIARAAALAVSRLSVRRPSGRIVAIQYLAEMLAE